MKICQFNEKRNNQVNPSTPCNLFEARWQELSTCYLPVESLDPVWRLSREVTDNDPEQGWKLHISASVTTANTVFEKIAPFLHSQKVLFKAPLSLEELQKINSGLYYGYSQVGKFITVYPRNEREAIFLAQRLHKLTKDIPAPSVPFDEKYRPNSCVHYRYGAFKHIEIKRQDGVAESAIRNPAGELVADVKDSSNAYPDWIEDAFIKHPSQFKSEMAESPLKTTYKAFHALAQRGKGGVYLSLDLSVNPRRLCILKEGRRHGETDWDGRDGHWRIKYEMGVLKALRRAKIDCPKVYDSFEIENSFFVVLEFIEGEGLIYYLKKRRKRFSIAKALDYSIQVADLISQIHEAGWIWMDCKPANFILTKDGRIRPIDFEGAIELGKTDSFPWCTMEFASPRCREGQYEQHNGSEDLYSLGVLIYYLFVGRLPSDTSFIAMNKLRRNVPQAICDVLNNLLATNPQRRPNSLTVSQSLREILASMPR